VPGHRQERIKELLEEAARRPPSARALYLDEQCGGDGALRSDVESLLSASDRAGTFLESPPLQGSLQPGQVLSHYQLVEKIGEGGMGVVWEALDTRLKRHIALKVLPPEVIDDPQWCRRFEREAQAAAALNHPNIAAVYEVDESDGVSFIVMELVRGRTLRSLIRGKPLPIADAIRIGCSIASGLAQAHESRIVHRDLKPDNIMTGSPQGAKILDFGLAKWLRQDEPSRAETHTEELSRQGLLLGTVTYMSPEQARGEPVDARSDVFSLGITLYEMVTGVTPFRGATKIDTLSAIIKDGFAPAARLNRKVPAELDRILARCLDKRPDGRYQHAGELLADLRRLDREVESGTAPVPTASWLKRRSLRIALGALSLAALIAAALMGRSLLPARADPRTILILPMEVRGQGEGADYAGRAFAETLAVEIARAAPLTVLRVPEAAEVNPSGGRAGVKAALDAGAGRLVSGALTREGSTLHASLSLLDTTRNRVIWGLRKEAGGDSLSSLASSLASELTAQLGVARPSQYDHFAYSTRSPALADSPDWIEAASAIRRFDPPAAMEATARLLEAFPAEPDARVLRANALLFDAWGIPEDTPQFDRFEASLTAIDEVDPDNPWDDVFRAFAGKGDETRESIKTFTAVLAREDLTPAARAFVMSLRGDARVEAHDFGGAFSDLSKALALDPANDVNYLTMSAALLRVGRVEEGFARARQAVALSPTSPPNNNQLGLALLMMDRFGESLAPLKKACEGRTLYCSDYAIVLSLAGHPDEALPRLAGLCATSPQHCIKYASALVRAGRLREARAAARRAEGLPETGGNLYSAAGFRAIVGERDEAIRLLKRSIDLGHLDSWIGRDPDFRSLHDDPQFQAAVAEVEKHLRQN
jgi:serine/threonine protein kinase/Flp pilus assembly protein TadD